MTTTSTPGKLSAWELGDLREISPSAIVRDEHDLVGRLIVRLALAFNDLKGMILFEQYLLAFARPEVGEVSAHAGQWSGISMSVSALFDGVVGAVIEGVPRSRSRALLGIAGSGIGNQRATA